MASTVEGRELTEANRKAQAAFAANVSAVASEFDTLMDLSDIEGSFPAWHSSMSQFGMRTRRASERLASVYVQEFGRVEADIDVVPGRPVFDERAYARDSYMDAVVMTKARISAGMSAEEAWRIQSAVAYGKLGQRVLDAGRTVISSAKFQYKGRSGRWRRVGDGAPCAFCGMLIGRGPVYSKDTVTFRSHNHCGCTAEIVIHEWEPTEREALFRASYLQAAVDAEETFGPDWARTAAGEDQILYRMRRNAPTLFNDGVVPKDD